MRALLTVLTITLTLAGAQAQPAPEDFAPIVIDVARYQQIETAFGKLAAPRDAHIALRSILQELEQQAKIDKARAEAQATKPAAAHPDGP